VSAAAEARNQRLDAGARARRRFLTAAATLAAGPVVVDGTPRMRERPIQELVDALRALGADCEARSPGGCPPVRVAGGGLRGGRACIDARRSSQFVSGILLAAPYAERDVELSFVGGVLVSRPFVDLTLQVMRAFQARAEWRGQDLSRRRLLYQPRVYLISPTPSPRSTDSRRGNRRWSVESGHSRRIATDGPPLLDARAMGCR
jgi:3-phosphoshikimate 1-carboxyvinyltransferase